MGSIYVYCLTHDNYYMSAPPLYRLSRPLALPQAVKQLLHKAMSPFSF